MSEQSLFILRIFKKSTTIKTVYTEKHTASIFPTAELGI